MPKINRENASAPARDNAAVDTAGLKHQQAFLQADALHNAILNSANFSSIATDENGIIQVFNVGAERMLGYASSDVVNKITPADICDAQELIARAKALSVELATAIKPGFEALVFKASRGIQDYYELTYICKDGSRHSEMVSVTALFDSQNTIVGYLLVGTNNAARKQAEAENQRLLEIQEESKQQLKQALATLEVSEENLSVTLNSIGEAVVTTDGAGRVTLLNARAQQLTGWHQAEAVGRPVTEVFRIIDQETRQASLMLPVMETLAHGTAQCLASHVMLIARNGSEHTIADCCAPIFARDGRLVGAVLVFRDVDEENVVRQALQDSTALTKTILDTVADGIITIRAEGGLIETVNAAAEQMFGYAAAEIIGERFSMMVPELDRNPNQTSLEYYRGSAQAQGTRFGRRVIGQRKDGSIFPMGIEVNEMWLDGQRYFIGVLRDITTHNQVETERALLDKRLNDQQAHNQSLIQSNIDALFSAARDVTERRRLDRVLQYKNAELEIARAAAEKANLAKSDFLSKMSHELRTPLNAILGFAQLLEAGSPTPTEGQAIRLQQIIKSGWYLLELINEILDLAVIESGRLSLFMERVQVQELVNECHALIEADAKKRDIHLDFSSVEAGFVYADRIRLRQVLLNLLSNAIKYNRPQGSVTVKCRVGMERIRISVQDSGLGLSPENLAQLFQPFNRLGQETGSSGTGIGLVVAKQLVELMGGNIGVVSTVGAGSEFWVELLWDRAPPAVRQNISPVDIFMPLAAGSAPRTLLYIEDSPSNLLLIKHIIECHPELRLLNATDGKLGVALAHAHRPDVILMDMDLPGISGMEALNLLRQNPVTKDIPVIALSAQMMPDHIRRGFTDGFFRYLTEPLQVSEFISVLEDALKFSTVRKSI